ncbi:MAG: CoA transferase subunit A [Deltaproteobacteria bacterium]|nr:CoA transferase subunit A [Deltaproteobacteria bacterium]
MRNKIISMDDAGSHVRSGMTVMIGGFLGCGGPNAIIDALLVRDIKELTVIANDTAFTEVGIGKLIVNHKIRHVICSHIGTNKETGRQFNEGETEVTLTPQGTLAGQIRAAGVGTGGFLTPTGVGTEVEKGKNKLIMNGVEYLLETPLKADVALIHAWKVDKKGNAIYRRTARNFNPLMAMAADVVICEAEHIVEVGEIDPDFVMTPSIFIDYIVDLGGQN